MPGHKKKEKDTSPVFTNLFIYSFSLLPVKFSPFSIGNADDKILKGGRGDHIRVMIEHENYLVVSLINK